MQKEGCYLYTLTLTDVATGWTECIPLLNKSQEIVLEGIKQARSLFPFPILGIDTDCGSEFINQAFVTYCDQEHLTFTRGHPQVKSDQCYVEQKNGAIIRQVIGHDRLEGMQACRQVMELYFALRLYVNCFQPSMKLLEKQREGSHVRRVYDPAKTPLQRLLLSGILSTEKLQELTTSIDAINPVHLFDQIKQLQQAVFRCEMKTTPFTTPSANTAILRFSREHAHANLLQVSAEPIPDPAGMLQTLRAEQNDRQHLLDWKRTRKDPFAGEWEQILAWIQASPERTSAEIFRALQRRSPGRYRPTQIRTLQRGISLIRARLLETEEQFWPGEARPGDLPPILEGHEENAPTARSVSTATVPLTLS
jgi:hypothetical protein